MNGSHVLAVCANYGYGCPRHGGFPGWALLWQLPLAFTVFCLVVWGIGAFRRMATEEKAGQVRRRKAYERQRGGW